VEEAAARSAQPRAASRELQEALHLSSFDCADPRCQKDRFVVRVLRVLLSEAHFGCQSKNYIYI
jgi:hypothetical protein